MLNVSGSARVGDRRMSVVSGAASLGGESGEVAISTSSSEWLLWSLSRLVKSASREQGRGLRGKDTALRVMSTEVSAVWREGGR